MKKPQKTQTSDEETLKHYTPNEAIPAATNQPHLDKILKEALALNPQIIKPDLSVDHTMAKRKTPVVPPAKKNKKK